LLTELNSKNTKISVLALQETWKIPHPELLKIPGFNLHLSSRSNQQGGGVGFYVTDELSFKKLSQFSIFVEKTFESLTIETLIQGKKTTFTSVYRSPNPPHNTSSKDHQNSFLEQLDLLLHSLSTYKSDSYIFLDSNINLLKEPNNLSGEYMESIHVNGFIQCIHKATRIKNQSSSLIDHILTNSSAANIRSGIIISDISDHFISFIQLSSKPVRQIPKFVETRNFSIENMARFKDCLKNLQWRDIHETEDVNDSYDKFWKIFSTLYNLHFPIRKFKFNKNFNHKSILI